MYDMILNMKSGLNSDNLNEKHYDSDYCEFYSEFVDVLYNVELLGLLNSYPYYN